MIVWIGPLQDPDDCGLLRGASPAAIMWQREFIRALDYYGAAVELLSYLPEPYFPKGRLYPRYGKRVPGVTGSHVSYINLPLIRSKSLAERLIKATETIALHGAWCITYNCLPAHTEVARFLKRKGVKWINIVAENEYAMEADWNVFLSYGHYLRANFENKYHLDGGVYICDQHSVLSKSMNLTEGFMSANKILLFSGTISRWTGVNEFAQMFSTLKSPFYNQLEFHVYGKGRSGILQGLAAQDSRIKLFGYVPNAELIKAMNSCYAFVNPRPLNIPGGDTNFPSKLLTYIPFTKPIISTKTEGLAPYYDTLLFYYKGLGDLGDVLMRISNLGSDDLKILSDKMNAFIEEHSWNSVVGRFIVTCGIFSDLI